MSIVDFISSGSGSCIAEILLLPLCTIRTNYQTFLHYKSGREVFNYILKTRGIAGFYNSFYYALTAQAIATSTRFTIYNLIRNYRGTATNSLFGNVINGGVAGLLGSIFSHPFEVLKIHKQNDLSFIRELEKIGYRLFYRGYSKSLSKNILTTALVFPLYDYYKSYVANPAYAALLTSIISTSIIQPVDVFKTRQISGKEWCLTFDSFGKKIKYLYRGFHLNLMRVVPHYIIMITIMEQIKKILA